MTNPPSVRPIRLPGFTAKGEFEVGRKAQDANDYIIHNQAKGKVFYDLDGADGGKKTLFAKVEKGMSLSHKVFQMIKDFVV